MIRSSFIMSEQWGQESTNIGGNPGKISFSIEYNNAALSIVITAIVPGGSGTNSCRIENWTTQASRKDCFYARSMAGSDSHTVNGTVTWMATGY